MITKDDRNEEQRRTHRELDCPNCPGRERVKCPVCQEDAVCANCGTHVSSLQEH